MRGAGDLRTFLAGRTRFDLLLLIPSAVLTGLLVYAFFKDYDIKPDYKPNIIYVQSWPLDRSDAEIRAQQRIDQAKKKREDAEIARRQKEIQAQFKKYDDALKKYGI